MSTEIANTNVRPASVTEIVDALIPQMEAALSQADDAPSANEIRHRVAVISDYLKRVIPKELSNRTERLRVANDANRVYLDACRKAGQYWDMTEKYTGRPDEESVQTGTLITARQAGFTSRADALRCVRAARLDSEDYRVYCEQCDQQQQQYTLHGLNELWRFLNPGEDGQGDITLGERLARIKGQLEDTLIMFGNDPDDIYQCVLEAYSQIMDAIEILGEED